jgi:hypothetical protein
MPSVAPFKRSLAVATSSRSRLVLEVEYDAEGELHVSGQHTTTAGGYSGGQIVDQLEALAAGIAREASGRRHLGEADTSALVEIWQRWHLNHMRPGCEHQTGPEWDAGKAIELHTYSMDWDNQRALERTQEREAKAAGCLALLKVAGVKPFRWSAVSVRQLAALSAEFEIVGERDLPAYRQQALRHAQGLDWEWPKGKRRLTWSPAPKPPVLHRVERKHAGHMTTTEHPEGLLSKPCPTCGYKYGSEWKREDIPAATLLELDRLTAGRPAPPPPDALGVA